MDKKILKRIVENRQLFVPSLFTARQVSIIEKYLNNAALTNTEKSYLYSAIKKKADALSVLKEELYITGQDMIPERVNEAREILSKVNGRAFISGTFLFSDKYNDIDIYVISNKRKQYHKDKEHFIFITEEDLKKPIFISVAKYSVSNFFIELKKPAIGRAFFDDLIMTYELAVNEILDNDDQKKVRDIIFEYYMHIKGVVLDSFSLYRKLKEAISLKEKEKIELVNGMVKELLLKTYSKKYLYNELTPFLKRLKGDMDSLKIYDNIAIYCQLLGEVKDECRRAKT